MNKTANQSRPRVCIATPMYGGMCTGMYTDSVIALLKEFAKEDMELDFLFLMNESLITRARNQLVHHFLQDRNATHLLFIDADIAFRAQDIVRMVKADLDILCGVCPLKSINWEKVRAAAMNGVEARDLRHFASDYAIRAISQDAPIDADTPTELQYAGTGLMMIKREVFERLADCVPQYLGRDIFMNGQRTPDATVREYFATGIEPGTKDLLSEDYHFCRVARENGIKIHGAPWVYTGHVGTHVFWG